MTRLRTLTFVAVAFGIAATVVVFARAADDATQSPSAVQADADWAADPIWHDGLVEKAVYDAEKVIYGHPRRYEATLLTNKEAHDPATWTKSTGGGGTEVWKFNQIEVVPTPNYDYKFETTCHLTTADLTLTRLDAASQEWCGASFKSFVRTGIIDGHVALGWNYFGFSYLPEQGSRSGAIEVKFGDTSPVVPADALALYLRGYDFAARSPLKLSLIPSQKSNKLEPYQPVPATVTFAAETPDGYALDVTLDGGDKLGTYRFAKDRRHVLLSYAGANGDTLKLKSLDRVDYWTRHEE